jgi:ribosomal protein S18 acetylase RimI-like enzyme
LTAATVRYRKAREDDVEETYRVMLRANADLNRRLGRPVSLEEHSPSTRAIAVRRSALRHDPDRFWVAEDGGCIVGFGLAIARRSFWYLAALHVETAFQARGVGGELLRRCLGDSETRPPTLLTISEAINLESNGLYGRRGMFPEMPIVQVEGAPASLAVEGVTLQPGRGTLALHQFKALDQAVLGEGRDEDHETWASVDSMEPNFVMENDRVVGYLYVDRAGSLGPAAVDRADLLYPTMLLGLRTLAEAGAPVARLRIPGVACESLDALLGAGFRYDVGINLFLASRPFGRFDRYLFSGADALF